MPTIYHLGRAACIAEIDVVSNADGYPKRPEILRYIAVRRPRTGTLGVKANQVPARNGHRAYAIRSLITNFPLPGGEHPDGHGPEPKPGKEVLRFANSRCGDAGRALAARLIRQARKRTLMLPQAGIEAFRAALECLSRCPASGWSRQVLIRPPAKPGPFQMAPKALACKPNRAPKRSCAPVKFRKKRIQRVDTPLRPNSPSCRFLGSRSRAFACGSGVDSLN